MGWIIVVISVRTDEHLYIQTTLVANDIAAISSLSVSDMLGISFVECSMLLAWRAFTWQVTSDGQDGRDGGNNNSPRWKHTDAIA